MNNHTIERVELKGIHGRYDLDISFNSSLNILFGENGSGKSTLVHIIANIANCDFIRFAFLKFNQITVTYSNEDYICVLQDEFEGEKIIIVTTKSGHTFEFSRREALDAARAMEDERYDPELAPELISKIKEFVKKYSVPIIRTSYFPAFRTMLEAWSLRAGNPNDSYIRRMHNSRLNANTPSGRATTFSRNLFGQFLPAINYPSPVDIEIRLNDEIRRCQLRIASYESSIFSESFVKVFSALLEGNKNNNNDINAEGLVEEISQLANDVTNNKLRESQEDSDTYSELRRLVLRNTTSRDLQSSASEALVVYRDALKQRQAYQQKAFESIDIYFEVLNSFLNNKKLDYKLEKRRRDSLVGLKFPDDSWSSIKVMSSGERQLLTMLYAVNRMSDNSIVLIDEPEISLHIDWQEDLLSKMMDQLGDRQIIVCTHSPAIASDFRDNMTEVVPIFNDMPLSSFETLSEEEEEEDEY